VACGTGALDLRTLQPEGGRRMDAAAFLAGHPVVRFT
jgi:methionyl-tRNA formyltransferase